MSELIRAKTIVKLDSQILNSIQFCGYRYQQEHIGNWRPNKKATALQRGGTMHSMLAHFYKQRMKPDFSLARAIEDAEIVGREAISSTEIPAEEFQDEDLRVFREYNLYYQNDGWEILAVEQPFSRILHESEDLVILWEGIVDLVIKDPSIGKATVDHKTESRKSNPFILSNQFQGYEDSFKLPVIVNKIGYQKTLPNNERFRRLVHDSTPPLLKEWQDDVVYWVKLAISWHEQNYFPRNRTSCDKYSGCIFQPICKVPEEVREFKLMSKFFQDKKWDPFSRDEE